MAYGTRSSYTLHDKKGLLPLGDDERWIYLTEDTFDTMNRVNTTAFHKALTSEWGENQRVLAPNQPEVHNGISGITQAQHSSP